MYEEKENICYITILKIFFYIFLIIYFVYHILNGKYGILSYKNANETLLKQNNILNKKKYEIEKKQNKINRLKSDSIDLDLLEEELKKNIGIIDKNEIVLFNDDFKKI